MSKCIVHFGMHKTGSSSIQQSLFDKLNDPAYHYVNLGNPNMSGSLATAFMTNSENHHANRKRGLNNKEVNKKRCRILKKLDSELKTAGDKTVILSGEFMSSPQFNEDELAKLCEFITSRNRSITAVGYIRSPKAFMESAFQQRVKGGGLDDFILKNLHPKYRKRFAKLERVLGIKNVHYWRFDPKSFPNHCVVQDFCMRMGIDINPSNITRLNEGLSLPALALLYAYRKYEQCYGSEPDEISENNGFMKRIRELPGIKLRFHSSLIKPIIDDQYDDIKWMEERISDSLEESLTKDDHQAISSEADIFSHLPEAARWLAKQLGPEFENRWDEEITPHQAAEWMQAYRLKLADKAQESRPSSLTVNEISRSLLKQNPDIYQGVSEKKIGGVIKEALQQIAQQINVHDEGLVKVLPLGRFRIKQVPLDIKEPSEITREILFEPRTLRPITKD